MRIKATIAYDGSLFYGFQRQKSTTQTVSGNIEKALKHLQINSEVVGSGRTDRGVHATGQVIHFDIPEYWQDLKRLHYALQQQLKGISIKKIVYAPSEFHARFSAQRRVYRYLFKTIKPSVFEERYVGYYQDIFDIQRLNEALATLCGTHDFLLFHKQGSNPHTTIRTLYQANYYTFHHYHIIRFEADSYLRSQVRLMVDTVMAYAQGKITKEALLLQRNAIKRIHYKLAPAEGLYLAKIIY